VKEGKYGRTIMYSCMEIEKIRLVEAILRMDEEG
jgi:hypothetical protein